MSADSIGQAEILPHVAGSHFDTNAGDLGDRAWFEQVIRIRAPVAVEFRRQLVEDLVARNPELVRLLTESSFGARSAAALLSLRLCFDHRLVYGDGVDGCEVGH